MAINDKFLDGFGVCTFDEWELEEPMAEDVNSISSDITFDQFVVECTNCKTLVRVKVAGDYLCPTCKIEFSVDKDQEVSFK